MLKNTLLFFISVIISLYLSEIFLNFYYKNKLNDDYEKKIKMAKKMNIDFDKRNRFEFFESLKQKTNNLYPYYNTFDVEEYFLSQSNSIISFGGISNITTILNNESGFFPVIVTDEHGFNNPKGLYKKNINTLLIGDSFIRGDGVRQNETVGAYMRKFDVETLSIAQGGFGPLLELALLIEYAKPLEPKNLFWFYFSGNDYIDLITTSTDPKYAFLKNYLYKENYSNNLYYKQEEIDKFLKSFSDQLYYIEKEKNLKSKKNTDKNINIANILVTTIKLRNLRLLLRLYKSEKMEDEYAELFTQILVRAKDEVKKWNGKLYFVHLPSYFNVVTKKTGIKNHILEIVEKLEIPYVDIQEQLFKSHTSPTSLFPFHMSGHYNSQGNYELANEIVKIIEKNKN